VLLPFAEYRLQSGRFAADYPFLFATAWRNTMQLASAAGFVGVFWILLGLWAGLFNILGIDFFRDLFSSVSFVYPATATLFGFGLALYQVRETAILGLYRASLNILGWLLPLAALLAVGFLVTLLFTGLKPLWKTGHATALMLCLQGFLLFLFNAAWQDGTDEATPILDPGRIGVASQVNRLLSGLAKPDDFDYHYLRFKTGRWGNAALQSLAELNQHPQAADIREKAVLAQKRTRLYDRQASERDNWTTAEIAAQFTPYPPEVIVDESFLRFLVDEAKQAHRYYLPDNQQTTPLLILDLNGDGNAEYILFGQNYGANVFSHDQAKGWNREGSLLAHDGTWNIAEIKSELASGKLRVSPPLWQDIEIGSRRYGVGR
jgi:hypothetical protein